MLNYLEFTCNRTSIDMLTTKSYLLPVLILTFVAPAFNTKPAFTQTASVSCLPVDLGLLGNYAMFATTKKMSISNSDTSIGSNGTKGDVGLGPGASQNFSDGQIHGVFFVDPTSDNSKSHNVSFHGGVIEQDLSPVLSDLQSAINEASSLTPTQTFNTINDYTVIKATERINVIEVTDKIQLSGQTLTFEGAANALFVVNIAGNLALSGSSKILLAGDLTPANVLFNVAGTASQSGDSIVNGTLIVPNGKVDNASANFYGAIYAPEIALSGGAGVDGYQGMPFGMGLANSCHNASLFPD